MTRLSDGFVGDSANSTASEHDEQQQQQQRQTRSRHHSESDATTVDEKEQIGLSDPEQPDVPQITSQGKDLEKGEVPPEKHTAADAAKERDPNLVRHSCHFLFENSPGVPQLITRSTSFLRDLAMIWSASHTSYSSYAVAVVLVSYSKWLM